MYITHERFINNLFCDITAIVLWIVLIVIVFFGLRELFLVINQNVENEVKKIEQSVNWVRAK